MEIKSGEKLLGNRVLPITQDFGRAHKGITGAISGNIAQDFGKLHKRIIGIVSGNIAGISSQSRAYEQSRTCSSHMAETKFKRTQALVEARRLSFR
jgi:hypothetical protein